LDHALSPLGHHGTIGQARRVSKYRTAFHIGQYIAVVMGTTLFHDSSPSPPFVAHYKKISLAILPWHARSLCHGLLDQFFDRHITGQFALCDRKSQVDKNIAGSFLPVGATINMTAPPFMKHGCLICSQSLRHYLNLLQQIIVALTHDGIRWRPWNTQCRHGHMIMVLQSVGLPAEAVAPAYSIDRPLDTLRTVVNVEGDSIGAASLRN